MAFDLLIKDGIVVDGSGLPRYRADVGVKEGKLAAIGRLSGDLAHEVIDAEGQVVAPGFVDGHTHMDAQVFWDPMGSCSCYHGVTSVVMGNCGFTLAPCREEEKDLVFRNLERAEDLSREAMLAGIEWGWVSFPEYLDAIDRLPKGINYAGYIGHSALRTYVMGERAFEEAANDSEVALMRRTVQDALRAGALGFSTTRSRSHETADNRPVASRVAEWSEIEAVVEAMAEINAGMLQIAPHRHEGPEYNERIAKLAVRTGRPVTQGMTVGLKSPKEWEPQLALMEKATMAGGRMSAQVHSREIALLLSFESNLPFDNWDGWREFRAMPLAVQKAQLQDPTTRKRLADIASQPYQGPEIYGAAGKPPDWEWITIFDTVAGPHRTLADVARERGVRPVDVMIDEALKHDLKLFFRQIAVNGDLDEVLAMMRHPRSVVTFSDSGAHVSQIMDSSLQTHLLSYWVRERQAFTLEEAIRKLTYDTATHWGFFDRGLVREGFAADLVIFDPRTVAPRMPEVRHDLPAGARRLFQNANGISATIVNGEQLLRNGEPTGKIPGRLLRSGLPA